jgi:hypothetical protein
MRIAITLPVRTWAALDVALAFFRSAPAEVAVHTRLTRHCRRFHQRLRHLGVCGRYVSLGTASAGKSLLRLQVDSPLGPTEPLEILLPREQARTLARACVTVIEVQTDPECGLLLDYEAEELRAAQAYLTAFRREADQLPRNLRGRSGRALLRWDDRHQEYCLARHVAERIHQSYRCAGAGLN